MGVPSLRSAKLSRGLAAPVVACALAGVTACSLVYGLDGFATDSPDSAETGDERAPAPDVGVPGDAGEAGIDANADVDTRTFCQRAPPDARLCDEFERTTALGSWTNERTESGGALFMIQEDGGSFLRATLPAANAIARAYLDFRMPGPATKIRYRYRIRVLSPLSGGSANVMVMTVGTLFSSYVNVGFTLSGSSTAMYEQSLGDGGGLYKSFPVDRVLTPGVFHDVDVTMLLDRSPSQIVVLIDGQLAATRDSQVGLKSGPGIQIAAGASYAQPSPVATIDIDDVLIERE